jgi:hypothetical protein
MDFFAVCDGHGVRHAQTESWSSRQEAGDAESGCMVACTRGVGARWRLDALRLVAVTDDEHATSGGWAGTSAPSHN